VIREFLQITRETAYKTPHATPARGTDLIVCRLDDGNSFTMRGNPIAVPIMYGGGYAVQSTDVSDKMEVKGSLKVKLCYSQALTLLGLGINKISADQTAPWTTTEPVGDLASVTIDHAILNDDTGGYNRTRYRGCKCTGGRLECSEESQVSTLSLDLQGGDYQGNPYDGSADPDATVFPVPADDEYPTDFVQYSQSGGGFFLGSLVTARAQYSTLSLAWTNKIDSRYFGSRFVSINRSLGREMTLNADMMIVSTPDDRTTFESLGPLAMKLTFSNGTNSILFDYRANSRIRALPDDLPLDKIYFRRYELVNRYDVQAHADMSITIT
jgi:hypothetical protein